MSIALAHHDDPRTRPQGLSWRSYWIGNSHGFRVDGPGGRIGIVEDIRDDQGEPLLVVRAGWLGLRVILVPAAEVFEILPRATRIWLRTPVSIAGTEPLQLAERDPVRGRRLARNPLSPLRPA